MSIFYTPSGTGAIARDVEKKLRESVSVLDYIPESLHPAIQARTSTTNVSSYIQAGIDYLDSIGGGTLTVPAGRYYCTAALTLKKNIVVQGEGMLASTFYFTSTNGFVSSWTINTSNAVHISLCDIGIQAASTSNTGIGFWETGGSFVTVLRCLFRAWKYHIALDQTELCDIDLCDFEYDNVDTTYGNACIWLVSGAELTAGSLGLFTNRISINRCQFNGSSSAIAVRIDGGYSHALRDNNYNGFKNHIHASGSVPLIIDGGEFESNTSDSIHLSAFSPAGVGKGQCALVRISNIINAPPGTTGIINVASVAILILDGNWFSGGPVSGAVQGAVNAYCIYEGPNSHGHNYPIVNGNSTKRIRINTLNGTIRTSSGLLVEGTDGGIGYATGAGGAVTQATSKSTGVTLDKASGAITMNGAALASATSVGFTLTNSLIAATDVVLVSIKSGATANSYLVAVDAVAAGSCRISVRNISAGSLSEALVLNFAVVKAVAA